MSDVQPPREAANAPPRQPPASSRQPWTRNLLRAARSWWHRVRPTAARDVADLWVQCTSWDEASQVLSRVSLWYLERASVAMVQHVPRCWPEMVPVAAQYPATAQAFLQRADCDVDAARALLAALPLYGQREAPWGDAEVAATLQMVGARGWSLCTLAPAQWRAVQRQIQRAPNILVSAPAWRVVLSVPDIPGGDWAELRWAPYLPGPEYTPLLFARFLRDPRLCAADRRALVAGPADRVYGYKPGDPAWGDTFPWQLPGALDGLCDTLGHDGPWHGEQGVVRAVHRAWAALGPQERPAFWAQWTEVVSPERAALLDALWRTHQDDLVHDPDATSTLLGMAGQSVRLEIILGLAAAEPGGIQAPPASTESLCPAPTRTGRSS